MLGPHLSRRKIVYGRRYVFELGVPMKSLIVVSVVALMSAGAAIPANAGCQISLFFETFAALHFSTASTGSALSNTME